MCRVSASWLRCCKWQMLPLGLAQRCFRLCALRWYKMKCNCKRQTHTFMRIQMSLHTSVFVRCCRVFGLGALGATLNLASMNTFPRALWSFQSSLWHLQTHFCRFLHFCFHEHFVTTFLPTHWHCCFRRSLWGWVAFYILSTFYNF